MLNTFQVTFFNIFNLVFGVIFGFIVMAMVLCIVISVKIKKKNVSSKIRDISIANYTQYTNSNEKDRLTHALLFEFKEVSSLVYPDKKFPVYELSINEIFDGINLVQQKLKTISDNPLMNNFRDIHIASLLKLNRTILLPVLKIKNHKVSKVLLRIYSVVWFIINLFNPVFYLKKILNWTLLKKGKNELIISALDSFGSIVYQIYEK